MPPITSTVTFHRAHSVYCLVRARRHRLPQRCIRYSPSRGRLYDPIHRATRNRLILADRVNHSHSHPLRNHSPLSLSPWVYRGRRGFPVAGVWAAVRRVGGHVAVDLRVVAAAVAGLVAGPAAAAGRRRRAARDCRGW